MVMFGERLGVMWVGYTKTRARFVMAMCLFAVFGFCLVQTSAALASPTSFTWIGQSKTTEEWSAPANWLGGVEPTSGEEIGTLTFPRLTNEVCADGLGTEPCYISYNDVSGLSVESIQIDDADDYLIGGDEIAIGSGGLTASPEGSGSAGDVVEVPFHLSAPQTWKVSGTGSGELGENGLLLAGDLTGSGSALTVEIGGGPLFFLAEHNTEVGPVTIEGTDTSKVAANGIVSILDAKLDSSDGEPVGLSHIFLAGSGAIGALTTNSVDLDVGSPDQDIEVASAKLDAASDVEFNVTGNGTIAQVDNSQLVSHGAVELAGSKIEVVVGPPKKDEPCPVLSPGETYTFVSTTGALTGAFSNAPEHGAEIPVRFAEACAKLSQTMRIVYSESGGTQTVTGTVEAGAKEAQEARERQEKEGQEAKGRQEAKEREEAKQREAAREAEVRKNEEGAAVRDREAEAAVLAAAAFAAKRQEEEIADALARKLQEETSAGKNEGAATQGSVSLLGSTIAVQGGAEAQVKLACSGTSTCKGKLTLLAKGTAKKGRSAKPGSTAWFGVWWRWVFLGVRRGLIVRVWAWVAAGEALMGCVGVFSGRARLPVSARGA